MTPNQVTAARVAAAFAAVALFTFGHDALLADVTAILLTIAAIALDGLDGYIARKRNLATPLGAQLDILGDRVVENLFFTFFAATGSDFVLDSGTVFCARHAHRFSAEPGSAKRTQRLRSKLDDRDVVGTKPGGFTAEPRGIRCAEVRVLLLSRIAAATAAASGYMVRCEFAPMAFGRRTSVGDGDGRVLCDSRNSCDLGWAPVSDERERCCDATAAVELN